MKTTEQGVLDPRRLKLLLVHMLLLWFMLLASTVYADNNTEDHADKNRQQTETKNKKHPVAIIYSPDNTLQKAIYEKLVESLTQLSSNIDLSTITDNTSYIPESYQPELIITIGASNIEFAKLHFLKTNKLLIISNPGKYSPKKRNSGKNNSESHNTLLYMTQPYCRQVQFIKLINKRWKTISYLSSETKPVDDAAIERCARKYGMKIYKVNTIDSTHLGNNVKDALYHSDLLLALPDKSIYNSKTVKNILLSSYRIRKPVIAFSRNFVNAGAIASIHSDIEQIASAASNLARLYFSNRLSFNRNINHPENFDISFNRQVFKALNLYIPDAGIIKMKLTDSTNAEVDDSQSITP